MRKVSVMIALVLLAVVAQVVVTQTRPRRVEQESANPPPSQPKLVQSNNPERIAGENTPATISPAGQKALQDDTDVLRIDTNLVTLPVSVTDRLGRYIPDLQKHEFRVYEDGTEQEIAYFAAVEKPFTVILMIDTSASNWSKLGQIRDAARVFVDQLRPDDQVMIASFATGLTIESEATTDRRKIRKGIDKTGKGLSTHLYDVMDQMMQKHLARIQGRKAIVLFTDGVDATSKRATYESTLRIAEEVDAIIYPIRYDTYDPSADKGNQRSTIFGIPIFGSGGRSPGTSRADYAVGERYLQELARLTAGHAYEGGRDLTYLRDAFTHIADELRRQYSLGYYPKQTGQPGERRHVRVRVARADLAVRTRDSYVFKGNAGASATPSPGGDKGSAPPAIQKKPLVRGI
jgi:VWFA-related protein